MGILGQEAITLHRRAVGTRSEGRYTPGAAVDSIIYASVQPLSGRELERLPEGERQKHSVKVYTETELRTSDQAADTLADLLVINSGTFKVLRVDRWSAVIPHYEAYAVREDEAGGEV